MWGLIPALNSQGAEPYRQALHKKALEPPVSHEPSVGDVPSSLLSLDDLLPGGRVDMILIRGTSKEPWGFSIEDNGGQNNSCTVEQVISGSIADGQQLMRGDVITAVNGYDVTGLSHRDVMKLIDQSGVELTLTIDPQPVQPFPMQQEPQQQQQQRYSHQHPEHQQLYEATERSSRYEAHYQGRSGQVNNDDAYTTQRSISAGPSNRDSQDFPASGLTELGWTPGARPKSKSGFQGSLIEPGWRSKSRPQPVMRSSAYVFQNEMGWSPKTRGKTTQAYTSNPSSNDMGWSPRVEPVKPTSAFTRVVSNNTGTLSESLNQPVYRRQQQYPPYESESTNMQQYPGPKQQRSQEPQGQQRTKQEYVENPHQSECYQQPEKQITKQEFEQVLKPQYEPQQNPIYDDNAQFLQAIKVQDPSNSEQNAQQQLQSNQYRIPDPQKISSQKIYQNPSEQRHPQKTSDQSQNPYYWSDYGTRRTSRRDRIDDDFVEGVPAWYGSLRPAGGRYDRWNSSTVQGSRSELTDTANKEEKDGWIPHGLDRETRMIQAQTVHAATLPYHPASTRLTAKQAAGQQADRLTAQQAAGLAAQQAAEQQLQKSVELTPQQAAGQQLQQQRRHQKQAYQQQLAQQNLSQTYNNEPHWTNYHKKQSTNQPSISQAVKGGHNDLGLCYGDKKEKYKSDIKDVHLVTATWTVPPQAAGHYEQPISHVGGQVVNVSQVQLYEDRHTYLGQETTQLQPQLPKVPQQFYQAGDEQSQLQTAGLQSEIAVPYQQLSAEAATGNIQNKTISSAFIDFYVLQESVTRHEAAVSFREVQEPEILPVVSKAPAEFSGGFVDFYVIPEGVTLKEINDKSIGTAEQKDFIQQLNETVSRGTGGVATGKTLTGGFVDFYVISEGSGSKALSTSIGKPEEAASKEEIKQVTVGETKTKQPDNIATGSQANALQPQVAHQANDNNNNTKSASSDKVKAANAIDNGKASGIKADIKQISATNAGIINQVVNGKTSNGKISATTPKTGKSAELVGGQMGKSTPQGGQQNRGVPKPQALSTPAAFRDQLKPAKTLPGKLK